MANPNPLPAMQVNVDEFLKLSQPQPYDAWVTIVHRYALVLNDDTASNQDKRRARSQISYFNHSFHTVARAAGVTTYYQNS